MKPDYSNFPKICRWRGRWPDVVLGENTNPYLLRWWITPWSRFFKEISWDDLRWYQKLVRCLPNIYLHKFLRSDDDRALHDHPWANISILLKGEYIEHMPFRQRKWPMGDRTTIQKRRKPGKIVFRKATAIHRVELLREPWCGAAFATPRELPVWSLFITGFRVRDWGFWCPQGWRWWRDFVDVRAGGNTIGRGCGDD